jgi:putative ABC transport system substrate-binding protein
MRRREFIAIFGSAAVTWPLAARAQPSGVPVIGFINAASSEGYTRGLSAFLKGLGEAGYVDGGNVTIEYRWAEGHIDRLPAMAAELVHRQVAVIAATSTPAALAAKSATTTIPIVFETGSDPVNLGLVASLDRPGGNVTGVTQLSDDVVPKEIELLHELLPTAKVMSLLVNPTDAALADTETKLALAAAHALGLELQVLNASSERDFDAVFANPSQLRVGGLVIGGGTLFTSHSEQLAALVVRHAVPAVYKGQEFAAGGGLLAYGSDFADSYHLAGVYTGRILKGDKPKDLPVQQATRIKLVLNLKAAKALGITVPLPLSGRADEVIE